MIEEIVETFLPVKGFTGYYEISDLGNIRNARSKRILHTYRNKHYSQIQLCARGEKKTKYIHRIVAEVFLEGFTESSFVFHLDRNLANNAASNLKIRNVEDYGVIIGERPRVYKRKTVIQTDLDGNFIREWNGIAEISQVLGYTQGNISQVCNGKKRAAYNYKWKFKEE